MCKGQQTPRNCLSALVCCNLAAPSIALVCTLKYDFLGLTVSKEHSKVLLLYGIHSKHWPASASASTAVVHSKMHVALRLLLLLLLLLPLTQAPLQPLAVPPPPGLNSSSPDLQHHLPLPAGMRPHPHHAWVCAHWLATLCCPPYRSPALLCRPPCTPSLCCCCHCRGNAFSYPPYSALPRSPTPVQGGGQ